MLKSDSVIPLVFVMTMTNVNFLVSDVMPYVGLSFGFMGWVGYNIYPDVLFHEGILSVRFFNFLR